MSNNDLPSLYDNINSNANSDDESSNITSNVTSNINHSNILNNQDLYSSSNIVNFTLNTSNVQTGHTITNQQGLNNSNIAITHTKFIDTNSDDVVNITADLLNEAITTYDDASGGLTSNLYSQISYYASNLNCSSFHGKGTIDDYSQLFIAASQIANDAKQMQLNVDIDGFNDFGNAADNLSALFQSFIIKLENISIIDDSVFLNAVLNALQKIYNLSLIFGKFKTTILATTTVSLPKSAHDTSLLLKDAMKEINCAIDHISYFVSPGSNVLEDAALSASDKSIINNAILTINNWNKLCEEGVSIGMGNNVDIQNIVSINSSLKAKTNIITNVTHILQNKLHGYNLI